MSNMSNFMFEVMPNIMPIIFFGIFGFSILMFIFVIIQIVSPKARGKMMSKHFKSLKHMTEYAKDDMEDVIENFGNISANAQNNIINQNEDILRNIATKQANINKDAIRTTASAIREGFGSTNTMFCKHCGSSIDADSKFCKSCGKEQ